MATGLLVAVGQASPDRGGATPASDVGRSAPPDLGSYQWELINGDSDWERRAGLQAVKLNGSFFVMGGRTPLSEFIPFASKIFGDVWESPDEGVSWTETVQQAPWPARAYFQAVTMTGKGKAAKKHMYVLGGQNFGAGFGQSSEFFNDVWRSPDGERWTPMTQDAEWEGRAGLSAVTFKDRLYVMGGSQGDDVSTGGSGRILFNDVWRSGDGRTWKRMTADAPWDPRAGGVAAVKDGYMYLLGGEDAFECDPERPDRCPPYFNDVWRSENGKDWELVTDSAEWSPRPGHQCVVISDRFVCFGGFGLEENPVDMWVSRDGASWRQIPPSPWNAPGSEQVKYDFDALVAPQGDGANCRANPPKKAGCSIYTFGGDRERFDLPPQVNFDRIDNDVWRFASPR
jgi:N-acetylneuraminic acid mutarotase